MNKMIADLQQDILKTDCDIVNTLRKAHLIAKKLKADEFDAWIQNELNGYEPSSKSIPAQGTKAVFSGRRHRNSAP